MMNISCPTALYGQCGEDLVEHAHAAPADEPVVDRLGGAVLGGRPSAAQTIADHEDDTADDSAINYPRRPMRRWQKRLSAAHLRHRQPDQIADGKSLFSIPVESTDRTLRQRSDSSCA